ncbi:CAP domain-containing protein [Bacillus safensis]|uniref:CAP domain-containing protein n=1 Tax=Bacillus TaxID=1386 RepID=UPI000771A1C5|nr:CAP domain-containing protein [Bacillus safensis]MCY1091282.1 CAP domain-containing protein [Bacillus safensis]MCY7465311.1 CAP domain-containing protein [Bacillus safensis]MDP4564221.1 CAP domain-containing protein [Bacillus safensis]MDV3450427.1 CAP domain-containing protein [Bacillus safensis]MEC0985782.1 CAP domain-containing protein [Bacillus safensis]
MKKKSFFFSALTAAALITFTGGHSADAKELNLKQVINVQHQAIDLHTLAAKLHISSDVNKLSKSNQKEIEALLNKLIKSGQPVTGTKVVKEVNKAKQEQKQESVKKPTASKPSTPAKENTNSNTKADQKDTAASKADSSLNAFEKEVVELTNKERAKQGLKALSVDSKLSKSARAKSQDMKDKNYFSHTSPTYGSPFDQMKQFGITYKSAGENIAQGQRSPQEVVTAWMNSEGHRANILNKSYTHIGVGYVKSGNYWTQQFIGK